MVQDVNLCTLELGIGRLESDERRWAETEGHSSMIFSSQLRLGRAGVDEGTGHKCVVCGNMADNRRWKGRGLTFTEHLLCPKLHYILIIFNV